MEAMDDTSAISSDFYEKGRDAMRNGRFDEAVSLFQQSVAARPHFKALELLGECLTRLSLWQEAIVPLAAASTLNKGVRAPSLLAEVFLHLGELSDAEAIAELALSRDAKNRRALAVKENVKQRVDESDREAMTCG